MSSLPIAVVIGDTTIVSAMEEMAVSDVGNITMAMEVVGSAI